MNDSPIFHLIYTSIASRLMPESKLILLLDNSVDNNITFGITGMLLYMESRFINKLEGRYIQFLEGEEKQVRAIYERIKADERHHEILLLTTGTSETRSFPAWSMGFDSFKEGTRERFPVHFIPDNAFFENDKFVNGLAALSYLKSFYEVNNPLVA